uniref:Cytochrome P450 n=1 Tax=Globisporangium ultimum (strain ATCC 200006 / CBS 805.95 / DAOM BR144) TaxID=431595 RepID=K3X3L1_GLOUD
MAALAVSPASVCCALLTIALSVSIVILGSALRLKLRIAKGLASVPGPQGTFLLGMLPTALKHKSRIHDFVNELLEIYGGRMKIPWNIFGNGALYVTAPENVQHILATNHSNYIKSQRFIGATGRVFGKSLLALNHAHTADNGEMVRIQRKVVVKVFTTSNFRIFSEQIFHKYAEKMIAIVESQGGKCDMHEISSQYTLQSIFDIACGISLQDVDPKLGLSFIKAMDYVFSYISVRMLAKPYYKYLWWCMPSEYKMKRNEQIMIDLAESILGPRLQESDDKLAKHSDIASLFIRKARELEGDGAAVLDVSTLRSIFLTFIFAGKDTTSSAITYTMYALAQYPDVQEKLVNELQQVKNATFTYEDVKSMRYLDAVVSETLRLYPTVPSNMKLAVKDDYLPDGTFVPAGAEVVYHTWYMGRHNPIFGDDPLVFRPERWLEMKTRPSAYDLPVFQAGPRICVGMNMALAETKMFVAVMVGSPEDIQHVLTIKYDSYVRGQRFIDSVGWVFDRTYLALNHARAPDNGKMLRIQRKLGVKVFTTSNFCVFSEHVFHKYAESIAAIVEAQGGKCDMHEVSSQYTMQTIFDVVCGIPLADVDPKLGLSFLKTMDIVFGHILVRLVTKPYYKYFWWRMPSEYAMKRSETIMLNLANTTLKKRLQESPGEIRARADIMSLFIQRAREQSNDKEASSVLGIRTLYSTFLGLVFAGNDTSSSVITYTFYALVQYPEAQ